MTDEAKPPERMRAGDTENEGAREAPDDVAGGGDAAAPEVPGAESGPAAEPAGEKPEPADWLPVVEAEATAALPAEGAGPTESLPASETEATEWLPAVEPEPTQAATLGGDGAPPFTPVPRAVKTSGGGGRRTVLWIVLAAAAIVVAAVLLYWAFAVRDTGEQFVGTWAPVSGEGGGLDIQLQDGSFRVSVYDPDLRFVGTFPAVRDGDVLTFRFSDENGDLGLLEAHLTYLEERDVLILQLAAMGEAGTEMEYVRVERLEPVTAPSPTPTPTPTPTGAPSPTVSPSPTPSPTGTDSAEYDQGVVDGIVAIQVGVLNWAAANGNTFPPVAEVAQDMGVSQYVSPWPTNPFTGQPMAPGDQPGDYTYEQINGGLGYRLVGHLANGLTFTVSEVP